MTRIIIVIALICLFQTTSYAQQDPMFSQYWVNAIVLNPAQAGAEGRTLVNLTGRHQWVNVKGAPKTYTLSIHGNTRKKLGLGLTYIHDRVGPSLTHTVNGDVSYHVNITEKIRLTAGVRVTALQNSLDLSDYYTTSPNDPLFSLVANSGIRPNGGVGFLITAGKLYMGYSQPRVMGYDFGSTTNFGKTHIISHQFGYAGFNLKWNDEIDLRPNVLVKEVKNAPIQVDFNLPVEILKKLIVGLSYRSREGIGAMFGVLDLAGLDFYYCYDYPLSAISLISLQTHQVTLVYPLVGPIKRVDSPRYFN